jgi:hypothetical protein
MAQVVIVGFSSWRSDFVPRSVHVRFVVDKVALGHIFLRVVLFSTVSIIPPWLFTLIYHLRDEE